MLRKDFPILDVKVNGNPLIYFDNAATTHKPKQVIDAIVDFYYKYNSNIHRGIHSFAEKTTIMYEGARENVAKFIGAKNSSEIVFTKGTTESINFIASTWGNEVVLSGDDILISKMEHHSNFIPWQQLALRKDANLKFIPVNDDGTLNLKAVPKLINNKTKIVSIVHTSNVTGTTNDVKKITELAHKVGAKVLIDAAQSVPHMKINVSDIGCDFFVFSGHKMLAPTGIGVLYINDSVVNEVPPYQFGGGMVFEVGFNNSTWAQPPNCYEAGTPPIAQAIGLSAAIDYINEKLDFDELREYEAKLCNLMIDGLSSMDQIEIIGNLGELRRSGHLVTFTFSGLHAHDLATCLNEEGISVRAGSHCAQPLFKCLDKVASIRASFYFYNSLKEVEKFIDVMKKINKEFSGGI